MSSKSQRILVMVMLLGAAEVHAQDVKARVCRWYDDKAAAFCLRFDDGHPSHLTLDAFKQKVDQTIAAPASVSFYFHAIGLEKGMGISQKPFEDMVRYLGAKAHGGDAWVGGIPQVHKYQVERDAANVAAELVAPRKLKIVVDCATHPELYDQRLTVRVDLPPSWSADDCQALDAEMKPMPAKRRSGRSTWGQLMLAVPPVRGTCYVQVPESQPRANLPDESARSVSHAETGLAASICTWYDGKPAAVSFQFDDTREDHLTLVAPMMREYGLRATFMINPGNPRFGERKTEWAALAVEGYHELANHSFRHRGAKNDDEAEAEVGEASKAIWALQPGKSRLLAYCSAGGLNITEEHLRAVLQTTQERVNAGELWTAGMAAICMYSAERESAGLEIHGGKPEAVALRLSCATNPELYDLPLTVQLTLPAGWPADKLRVRAANGHAIPTRNAAADGKALVRFDVQPISADYVVSRE